MGYLEPSEIKAVSTSPPGGNLVDGSPPAASFGFLAIQRMHFDVRVLLYLFFYGGSSSRDFPENLFSINFGASKVPIMKQKITILMENLGFAYVFLTSSYKTSTCVF